MKVIDIDVTERRFRGRRSVAASKFNHGDQDAFQRFHVQVKIR